MHKAFSTTHVRRLAALATLILLGTLSSACTYATVGSGEVAVVWTPEGKKHSVYTEGEWPIGYWDKATVYNARSQEREERLEVLAANGLRIVLDTSVRYHIDRDRRWPSTIISASTSTRSSSAQHCDRRRGGSSAATSPRRALDPARGHRASDPRGGGSGDPGPTHHAQGRPHPQRDPSGGDPGGDQRQAPGRADGSQDEVHHRAGAEGGGEAARRRQGRDRASQDEGAGAGRVERIWPRGSQTPSASRPRPPTITSASSRRI